MHNSPKNLMKLIATDTQTLLVFESTTLKWAAQLPFTPIIMKRGNFMVNQKIFMHIQFIAKKRSPGGLVVARLLTMPRVRGSILADSTIYHRKIHCKPKIEGM